MLDSSFWILFTATFNVFRIAEISFSNTAIFFSALTSFVSASQHLTFDTMCLEARLGTLLDGEPSNIIFLALALAERLTSDRSIAWTTGFKLNLQKPSF